MNTLTNEMKRHVAETIRHSAHVEYYLEHLGLGKDDPQRPHDIVGSGNKLEWEVAKGMFLLYANPKPDFNDYILPSIEKHRRGQHHHQMWNLPDPSDSSRPNPKASINDLLVGAVDAVCSMIESRVYAGGKDQNEENGKPYSWEDIEADGLAKFDPHKRPYVAVIVQQMKALPRLDVGEIKMNLGQLCLSLAPDQIMYAQVGLSKEWYNRMQKAIRKAVTRLERTIRYHARNDYHGPGCTREGDGN